MFARADQIKKRRSMKTAEGATARGEERTGGAAGTSHERHEQTMKLLNCEEQGIIGLTCWSREQGRVQRGRQTVEGLGSKRWAPRQHDAAHARGQITDHCPPPAAGAWVSSAGRNPGGSRCARLAGLSEGGGGKGHRAGEAGVRAGARAGVGGRREAAATSLLCWLPPDTRPDLPHPLPVVLLA